MIDYFQSISQNQLPDALHKKNPKGHYTIGSGECKTDKS